MAPYFTKAAQDVYAKTQDAAVNIPSGFEGGALPQRRSAEFTAHAAAHLRRNALGITVFVFHQHAFDEIAVRQAEKIFFRAVRGNKGALYGDAFVLVFA